MAVLIMIAILVLLGGSSFALASSTGQFFGATSDQNSASSDANASSSFSSLWDSLPGSLETWSMKLSAADISGYASAAGFSGGDLATAIAIALAESSGNPQVVGDQSLAPTKGPSIGLWQINIGSKAHPELASQDLTDPQTNANAAYSIYQAAGYSFRPWSTFTNGAFRAYMSSAAAAVNA